MKAAGLNIADWRGLDIYRAVGCESCNNTGYKGRMAIHEALYFTKEIRQIIVRSGEEVDEEAIRKQSKIDRTLSLRESGFEKVKSGITSLEEVLSSTMED